MSNERLCRPTRPGRQRNARETGLDPDLHRVAGGQRAVNRTGGEAFATDRVGEAVVAGQIENDRPVDAVSGRDPITPVDVADEILIGVAPAEHAVVASHRGQPDVRVLLGEQLRLTNIDSVVGEPLLQRSRFAIKNHALLNDRHRDRDGGGSWCWRWREGRGWRWRKGGRWRWR